MNIQPQRLSPDQLDDVRETTLQAERRLAAILTTRPSNEPQVSPQEYECGCVVITRITDRDCRTWRGYDEKPFEMRLALTCDEAACELAHLKTLTIDVESPSSVPRDPTTTDM